MPKIAGIKGVLDAVGSALESDDMEAVGTDFPNPTKFSVQEARCHSQHVEVSVHSCVGFVFVAFQRFFLLRCLFAPSTSNIDLLFA